MRELWRRLSRPSTMMAIIWCCMLFFAFQASADGLYYIFGPLKKFDPIFRDKYSNNLLLVRAHAVASTAALTLGLLTFVQELRKRGAHALLGRVYAIGVLVGGLTSIPMAFMAEGGWTTRTAFLLQGSLWLLTLALAVRAARTKRFLEHRRFMVRNYALTYSAVVSRLLLHGLQQSGLNFHEIYPVVAWTWVSGLAMGEWWLWYSGQLRLGESIP